MVDIFKKNEYTIFYFMEHYIWFAVLPIAEVAEWKKIKGKK